MAIIQWLVISIPNALMVISPQALVALPSGAQVTHGSLQVSQSGNFMQINQLSQRAIANWQGFSIGQGQTVNIQQLSAQSALLNRVVGADPSRLLGNLNANGSVFLINPNGIVVGENARIDAGSFFATTARISDASFLAGGQLHFFDGSDEGIRNLGVIRASSGDVVIVAHTVDNQGNISAENGVAALGAATSFYFVPDGDQRIVVEANLPATNSPVGLDNSGVIEAAQAELKAADGDIFELAVNQTGYVKATGVEHKNGRIILTAQGGTVTLSGEIVAQNADGNGGEALVGGGYQGGNSQIANASNTVVTEEALIDVSATSKSANGG